MTQQKAGFPYVALISVFLALSILMGNSAHAGTVRVTAEQFTGFTAFDGEMTVIGTTAGTYMFSDKFIPANTISFIGSGYDDVIEYDARLVSIDGGDGNNVLVVPEGTAVDLANTENQVPGSNCIVRNFDKVTYFQVQ